MLFIAKRVFCIGCIQGQRKPFQNPRRDPFSAPPRSKTDIPFAHLLPVCPRHGPFQHPSTVLQNNCFLLYIHGRNLVGDTEDVPPTFSDGGI